MNYLLGFFLLFVAVGIVLKLNALMLESRRPRVYYHYAPRKKETISQPTQKFLALIAVAIIYIVGFTLDKTYYNHYLLTFLFISLGVVWIFSVSVVAYLTTEGRKSYYSTGWRSEIFLTLAGLALTALSLLLYPWALENLTGLFTKPAFSTGVVERKYSEYGSRVGPLLHVLIDDERYQVLDYGWWQSINKGDQISFVYNPSGEFDDSIFQPEKISFSTSGILVSGVGVALWLATIGISLNGYGTFFKGKPYDYELPSYDEFYAQPGNTIAVETRAKQKRSIVWLIVGGLVTVLLFAWRNFRRATKSS